MESRSSLFLVAGQGPSSLNFNDRSHFKSIFPLENAQFLMLLVSKEPHAWMPTIPFCASLKFRGKLHERLFASLEVLLFGHRSIREDCGLFVLMSSISNLHLTASRTEQHRTNPNHFSISSRLFSCAIIEWLHLHF
jgi:hypothetical protein